MTIWPPAITRRALAALATTPLLAACGGDGQLSSAGADPKLSPSKGPVTVVPFLSGISDAIRANWDTQIVAAYKQRFPNVTIDLVAQTGGIVERIEKMSALMAAGSPLDLGDGPLRVRPAVAQNLLDPALDSLVKRDKYNTKKFNQAHFTAGATLDGKTWAIPFRYAGNAMCMACNVTLFREAGVALPPSDVFRAWTWDEFTGALTRLTKRSGDNVTQFGLAGPASIVVTWPRFWNGEWISPDLKTITCDTREMQECYTRIGDLFSRLQVVPRPGEDTRLFGNANTFNTGKAAILLFPPTGWATYGAGAQVDYALAPLPKGTQSVPDMESWGMGLYQGGKVTGDAWEFLKFLVEDSRYARAINFLPTVVADIEPWVKAQLSKVPSADSKAFLSIVERAGEGSSRLTQHTKYAELTAIVTPVLTRFMNGEIPASQMLQGLKSQLQQAADAK